MRTSSLLAMKIKDIICILHVEHLAKPQFFHTLLGI